MVTIRIERIAAVVAMSWLGITVGISLSIDTGTAISSCGWVASCISVAAIAGIFFERRMFVGVMAARWVELSIYVFKWGEVVAPLHASALVAAPYGVALFSYGASSYLTGRGFTYAIRGGNHRNSEDERWDDT